MYLKKLKMNCNTNTPHYRTILRPRVENTIHNIVNTAFGELLKDQQSFKFNPATNVMTYSDKYELAIALPGYNKDEVQIEVKEQLLSISSNVEAPESNGTPRLKEFNKYAFTKTFKLPKQVDGQAIVATFKNGVLTLTLPLKQESLPKEPKTVTIL
jgi:HSP20 family protein